MLFVAWFSSIMIPPFGEIKEAYLVLSVDRIIEQYQVWTLFTHAFFEPGFMAILFAGIAIWLFGAEIEQQQGTAAFWKMVIVSILASGVVVAGLQFVVDGAYSGFQAPTMALVAAYCWKAWNRRLNFFFVPMTGKTMLAFFLGLSIVMSIVGQLWLHLAATITGALMGIVLSGDGMSASLRDIRTRYRLWSARRRLKIVRTPEDDKPNGKSKSNGIDRKYMN